MYAAMCRALRGLILNAIPGPQPLPRWATLFRSLPELKTAPTSLFHTRYSLLHSADALFQIPNRRRCGRFLFMGHTAPGNFQVAFGANTHVAYRTILRRGIALHRVLAGWIMTIGFRNLAASLHRSIPSFGPGFGSRAGLFLRRCRADWLLGLS